VAPGQALGGARYTAQGEEVASPEADAVVGAMAKNTNTVATSKTALMKA
jgi:hypothetical protein